jgi:hypothetical protein
MLWSNLRTGELIFMFRRKQIALMPLPSAQLRRQKPNQAPLPRQRARLLRLQLSA